MNMLGSSTFLLSLMSTVASVPFFLFTLPAGALADLVDRRKLLCFMNLWLALAAGLLAILGLFHLVSPYVLLFCVFLIGVGFAFHAPAWSAMVPDLVTDQELPSARRISIEYFWNYRPSIGRYSALLFWSKLGLCAQRPLFRFSDFRFVTVERH
jgi:MFS family permease